MIFIGCVYKYIPATWVTFRGKCTREATFQVGLALDGIVLFCFLSKLSECTVLTL